MTWHLLMSITMTTSFGAKVASSSRREKKIFKISVFFDDYYENVEDFSSHSVDVINRILKASSFQFEYSINKAEKNNSYRLTRIC